MARARIQLEHQRDFTGGLNVNDDPYNLAPNESFDLANVDIDRRGGFAIRRGSRRHINTTTGLSADIDSIYTYMDMSGVHHVIAAALGQVRYWTNPTWTQLLAAPAGGETTRFVEMRGDLYIIRPATTATVQKWNGTGAATSLAEPAYNDSIAAPNDGNFPRCKVAAVHNGVMFCGNLLNDTLDSAAHPSRIRWSHPGKPEDWRTNDWIDIDPEDGCGEITALVEMGDRLVVFKERAVYAVHGFPPEGFSVTNVTKEAGTPSPFSLCVNEETIYFWDAIRGAYSLSPQSLKWIMRPIFPFIDDKHIDLADTDIRAAFHNDRVWFGVNWQVDPYDNTRVGLVWAPYVGKEGCWTLHSKSYTALRRLHEDGGECMLLGGSGLFVMELDIDDFYYDENTAGVQSRIDAHYTTRWFDGQNPALRKRFKRSIIVVGRNANQEFHVDVFKDYDPTHVQRSFSMFTDVNGTEGVWDVSDWDEVVWADEIGEASMILKGSPLGTGTAKALRFSNITAGVDWRVHGLTMKWIPKLIRN